MDVPGTWKRWVDQPQTPAEVEALREAVRRSRPFGTPTWTAQAAARLHLDWTLHPRGRPPSPRRLDQNHEKELRPL